MFQQCAVGIEPRTPFKQCPANVPQGEENSAGKIVSAGGAVCMASMSVTAWTRRFAGLRLCDSSDELVLRLSLR